MEDADTHPPSERSEPALSESEASSGVFGGRAPVEDYGGGGWVGILVMMVLFDIRPHRADEEVHLLSLGDEALLFDLPQGLVHALDVLAEGGGRIDAARDLGEPHVPSLPHVVEPVAHPPGPEDVDRRAAGVSEAEGLSERVL